MQRLKQQSKLAVALLYLGSLSIASNAMAGTDTEAQQGFAQARAKQYEQDMDHAEHKKPNMEYHGVFYGYLPCNDCSGFKNTLSLKHKNNYLLVTQYARESSREYFEKGKYVWDENKKTVTLKPNKDGSSPRYYRIKDAATLVQLNSDGATISKDADRYILQRSDTVQSTEIHIH